MPWNLFLADSKLTVEIYSSPINGANHQLTIPEAVINGVNSIRMPTLVFLVLRRRNGKTGQKRNTHR